MKEQGRDGFLRHLEIPTAGMDRGLNVLGNGFKLGNKNVSVEEKAVLRTFWMKKADAEKLKNLIK